MIELICSLSVLAYIVPKFMSGARPKVSLYFLSFVVYLSGCLLPELFHGQASGIYIAALAISVQSFKKGWRMT